MSTSETSLKLAESIIHQEQPISSTAELAITTSSSSTSGSLTSSSTNTTIMATTKSDPTTFHKPFNFIDVIVAAFTALLLACRFVLFKGKNENNQILVSLNQNRDDSSITDVDTIDAGAASSNTMKSESSLESYKELQSGDDISVKFITIEQKQHYLTESSMISKCSKKQDIEYFLPYGNNISKTERYLLAIPEVEEENEELHHAQRNSSFSLSASATIPNTLSGSEANIQPESSNSHWSISSDATGDQTLNLTNYNQQLNLTSYNLDQNFNSKLFTSNQSRKILSSDSLPLVPSILSETRTQLATTNTTEHLTFDIPDLPAIDSEDVDNNSEINFEISRKTPINSIITNHYLNNSCGNFSTVNNLMQQNKMRRNNDTVFSINNVPSSSLIGQSNSWNRDRDQNDLIINGLLDTITNEETCSLNSTSISIDHSRDSVLDFSICSNPIDEAAIMEEQLAANGELNDDDPSNIVTRFSSCVSKDNKHSLAIPTIVTTVAAVASTTNNNFQPVLSTSSFLPTTSILPVLFNVPPIASPEDLTSSDIISSRSKIASTSATTLNRNGIKKNNLKGRGHIGQGIDDNGKDGDDGDNDDINGKSDYYRQTSAAATAVAAAAAASTIKRYIIRSGWFFRLNYANILSF